MEWEKNISLAVDTRYADVNGICSSITKKHILCPFFLCNLFFIHPRRCNVLNITQVTNMDVLSVSRWKANQLTN